MPSTCPLARPSSWRWWRIAPISPNAIALNSSMVNAARLIGPSVAGLLIAGVGEGYCFLIDAGSYLFVIASLLMMRIPHRVIAPHRARVLEDFKEGFSYVARFTPIRSVLLLLAVVSLMGTPYTVLLPVIAKEVLGGGPNTLGALTAVSGLGALGGALPWPRGAPSSGSGGSSRARRRSSGSASSPFRGSVLSGSLSR